MKKCKWKRDVLAGFVEWVLWRNQSNSEGSREHYTNSAIKENKTVTELMEKKMLRGEPSQALLEAMGVHDEGNKLAKMLQQNVEFYHLLIYPRRFVKQPCGKHSKDRKSAFLKGVTPLNPRGNSYRYYIISLSVIGGGGGTLGLFFLIKWGPLQYCFFQSSSVKHTLRLFVT